MKPRILLAAALLAITGLAAASPATSQTAATAPVKILTIGDSITHGGSTQTGYGPAYRAELSRLLNLAGIAHTYEISAWPGANCPYIATEMAGQLSAYQPQLVILSCGTNDWPGQTEAPYRQMLSQLTATGTPAVATWVQYSDPRTAPQGAWIVPNEKAANDAIYRAKYAAPAFTGIPIADLQAIPGNLEHLDQLGIHPSVRGYKAMAHIIYTAAAPLMGWPSLAQLGEPVLCGLSGNWRDYPEPRPGYDYTECTRP